MREERANTERVIARIAARQQGVISSAQLEAAGIDKDGISRRASAGRLHRLHRGVYAVGHPRLTFEGRCIAAALAVAPAAVVSHVSAAALWGMLQPTSGPIHVTVPGDGGRRKRQGIVLHRSAAFIAGFQTRRSHIPVTTPARTLRDLRRTESPQIAQRALRRALDLRLISDSQLRPDADLTRSELERLFLALCRRHRLPQPAVNVRIGPYEVDFLWREAGLVVETDGFRHHGHRAAFERDRARDAELQARGYRVLRFTYRQVRDRGEVANVLRPLLLFE